MTFTPFPWKNRTESKTTPIDRQNLNAAEEALASYTDTSVTSARTTAKEEAEKAEAKALTGATSKVVAEEEARKAQVKVAEERAKKAEEEGESKAATESTSKANTAQTNAETFATTGITTERTRAETAENALAIVTINAQTVSYTLAISDASKVIELNSSSAIELKVPTNASVAFAIGTCIEVTQIGTGTVTIAAVTPGTTTILTPASLTTRTRYSTVGLRKRATDTWVASGDLS